MFTNLYIPITLESLNWVNVITIQIIITLGLIANCVMSKNYHGFMCEKINPQNFRVGALTEGAFVRQVLLKIGLPAEIIETLTGRKLSDFEPKN